MPVTRSHPFRPTKDRSTPWWIRPLLIAIANVAIVLLLTTVLDAWNVSMVAMVTLGSAFGIWWFVGQRPRD